MMNAIKSLVILMKQKKILPKKEKELNNLKARLIKKKDKKKEPIKKIRTDKAISFSDEIMKSLYSPEQRSADLDKEERLLKNDDDKINNLSKRLKKGYQIMNIIKLLMILIK